MSWMNSRAVTLLERSLDATSMRQRVLANNISNIDTPNFKRSDVSFETALRDALNGNGIKGRTTDDRHIPIGTPDLNNVRPSVYSEQSSSLRQDGNNVDIDAEMANMAQNQIQYNALIQQINRKFASLKYAISEGKR